MTEPTDAELIAELEAAGVVFMAFRGGLGGTKKLWTTSGSQDAKKIAAGMRAAIAKWGTPPAVAGEKVYLVATGLTNEAGTVGLYERHDRFVPLADCEVLYTAPQPTQPQAVAGGEPVAWLSVDCIGERYLCFTRPDDDDPVRPLVFGDTAPQAVREPFTPAQQERMYRNRPNNVGKSASLAEWRRLEYIERAYDIAKGGRHCAE